MGRAGSVQCYGVWVCGRLCLCILADSMHCRSRLTLSQVRCVFSSPEELIAHYPALALTKLNPRSIFRFDAWVEWCQRTSSSCVCLPWCSVAYDVFAMSCRSPTPTITRRTRLSLAGYSALRPRTRCGLGDSAMSISGRW
jgi:hypothetical protein